MSKTGTKAHFKMGEGGAGAVILPTKFVTASSAQAKGQRYADLIRYADDKQKVNETNNVDLNLNKEEINEQFYNEAYAKHGILDEFGYANRPDATTESQPLFNSEKLNLSADDVKKLRRDLDTAQKNGNTLHELAFSIRGDWLAKNGLYDPKEKIIDQNRLKHAEQGIVEHLFNDSLPLPLGEGKDDVVWFGVIHQDTDHLNMHLWFVKKSEETRPEMVHQKTGEPIGVLDFKVKKQAESKFRAELENRGTKVSRTELLGRVDERRKSMKVEGLDILDQEPKYMADLKQIYDELPADLHGRWKVGNTDKLVTDPEKSRMAPANVQMNKLIDKLLANELKYDYQAFREDLDKADKLMTQLHGEQHQGQRKMSETKDNRLRKELANGIYRKFNQHQAEFEPTNSLGRSGFDDKHMSAGNHQANEHDRAEGFRFDQEHQFKSESAARENAKTMKSDRRGNFEQIKQSPKLEPYRETSGTEYRGHTPSTIRALNSMSKTVVRDAKADLKRTRQFLMNQEEESRINERDSNVDSIPNTDIKFNARHM
ncbi:IS110 family transposase [Weissella minor]|uniref:MobP2 family relaxase n=1 Tax=Weissella minor TaxID=1620 RepID=UPI001BAFBA88|nr:MobP2 family relaxase [Weissella minor]MBS0949243.1 IS110 family transposase [Weissella minor]